MWTQHVCFNFSWFLVVVAEFLVNVSFRMYQFSQINPLGNLRIIVSICLYSLWTRVLMCDNDQGGGGGLSHLWPLHCYVVYSSKFSLLQIDCPGAQETIYCIRAIGMLHFCLIFIFICQQVLVFSVCHEINLY